MHIICAYPPNPLLPPLPLLPSPPPPEYTFLLLLLLLLLPVRAGMRSHSPHADRRLLRVSPVASDCQSETCQLIGPVLTLHVSLPVLGRERPVVVLQVVLPDRALCLPTFSHLLIVNKSSSSSPPLSPLSPFLNLSRSLSLSFALSLHMFHNDS